MRLFKVNQELYFTTLYALRPRNLDNNVFLSFIKAFKASPDSEYEELVKRISNLVLCCGENITSIYNDFYADEYSSFTSFLEVEEELDSDIINSIMSWKQEDEDLWKISISNYETFNFMTLFDDKNWDDINIIEIINSVLEGINHENI